MDIYQKYGMWYDLIYSWRNYDAEADAIRSYVRKYACRPIRRILDLACGTGTLTAKLADEYAVTGIDASPCMIKSAWEKYGDRAHFILGDFMRIPFRAGIKFDAVFCLFNGFGYILTDEAIARFLAGIKRVIADRGMLVLDFWHNTEACRGTSGLVQFGNRALGGRQIARGKFDVRTCIYDCSFEVNIHANGQLLDRFFEKHTVRTYSIPEMRHYLRDAGFEMKAVYEERTLRAPTHDTCELSSVSTLI